MSVYCRLAVLHHSVRGATLLSLMNYSTKVATAAREPDRRQVEKFADVKGFYQRSEHNRRLPSLKFWLPCSAPGGGSLQLHSRIFVRTNRWQFHFNVREFRCFAVPYCFRMDFRNDWDHSCSLSVRKYERHIDNCMTYCNKVNKYLQSQISALV
jgi:hypothetical protein